MAYWLRSKGCIQIPIPEDSRRAMCTVTDVDLEREQNIEGNRKSNLYSTFFICQLNCLRGNFCDMTLVFQIKGLTRMRSHTPNSPYPVCVGASLEALS